ASIQHNIHCLWIPLFYSLFGCDCNCYFHEKNILIEFHNDISHECRSESSHLHQYLVHIPTHFRTIFLLVLSMDNDSRVGIVSIHPAISRLLLLLRSKCMRFSLHSQSIHGYLLAFPTQESEDYCSETLWTTWKWPLIVAVHAISFIVPLTTRWPAVVIYVYDPDTDVFIQKRGSTMGVIIAMICYGSLLLSICIAANAYAAYCLLKFRATSKTSKNELSFTLISFCIFLAQTMNISIVILSAIFAYTSNTEAALFLSTITPYTSDIFSLGPAVYTILVPGPIRNRIVRVIRRTLNLPNNPPSLSKVATTLPSR
ncbi:hypothetical protein PENTCL1PPCAC_6408, partial [Pristionchus entomophagus]